MEQIGKIRVLHIITRLVRGGADENTIHNIRGLDSNIYDVDLLVGGESDLQLLADLTDINYYVLAELKRDVNPWADFVGFFKLVNFIKRKKYSIVHTHTAKAGILGRIAGKLGGAPIIVHTLHGITFHDFMNPIVKKGYIILERITGYFTDYFITVGEDLKNKYLDQRIGRSNQYETIYSGFPIDKFIESCHVTDSIKRDELKKLSVSSGDVFIGTVTRLEPRKGHTYLFQAATKIVKQHPNVKFLIIGEGPYREQLEIEVRNLNLQNNVVFVGYREDVGRIISFFDIFVLTSLWEGLPRVLVQAALAEKPIVTFEVEGAWEVVKDGVNGYIVPSKNVEKLSDRLFVLLSDLEKAKTMGVQGRKIVNNNWDVSVMVKNTSLVYERLLQMKKLNGRF